MGVQSPIKVNEPTKERIRVMAAFLDTTQSEIVDRAVQEFAVRHVDLVNSGIDRARALLTDPSVDADVSMAADLLGVSRESVERVSGLR